MKAMMFGFAAIILIAIVAYVGLDQANLATQDVQSGDNVRLD